MADVDRVLAILPAGFPGSGAGPDAASAQAAPAELLAVIAERELARARRDFAGSDRLRARALELGYALEDVKGGATRWKKA
jgi:cysteinyl-tRNA synthetase